MHYFLVSFLVYYVTLGTIWILHLLIEMKFGQRLN